MKLYIRSVSSDNAELQQALQDYDDRKAAYDARMKVWDRDGRVWHKAYTAWEEEVKTNPDTPRPDPNKLDKVHIAPWCDPEYSMNDAEHNVTVKALDSIAGQDKWIKVGREYWVKVLSRTKNVRKYIYYTCQWFCDCSLGSNSFSVVKRREDELKVDIPLEILDESEFCEYVANKFSWTGVDATYVAEMIHERAN